MGDRTILTMRRIGKIAHFEKLENLSRGFQNGPACLGRVGKASLSEFPKIYALSLTHTHTLSFVLFVKLLLVTG